MSEFDPHTPRFGINDVVAVVPGLAANTFQQWVKRGLVRVEAPHPGTGRKRLLSALDVIGVAFVADLAKLGIPPSESSCFVPQVIEWAAQFLKEHPPEDGPAFIYQHSPLTPEGLAELDDSIELRRFIEQDPKPIAKDVLRASPKAASQIKRIRSISLPAGIAFEFAFFHDDRGVAQLLEVDWATRDWLPRTRIVVDLGALAAQTVNRLIQCEGPPDV